MDWLWYDANRDASTWWWTIDPETGQPNDETAANQADCHCLGESVLDDVSLVADALATTFATKHFTDEEVAALFQKRIVPASFRGGPDDAAELVEHVDDLWTLVESNYVQALGRPPDQVERHWLYLNAFEALRARGGRPNHTG